MNLTALAVLAATTGVGQPATAAPPPADVRFVNKRTLTVPVAFKPERIKDLDKARLFVSRDNGATYEFHRQITPLEAGFLLEAKDDGVYWVQMQLIYRDGTLDPKDPTAVPPAEKLVIDTAKPTVTILSADAAGDELAVEWKIEDRNPADATTKVFYKPTGGDNTTWKEAPATAIKRRTIRFKPELTGPLTVQVATADLAGNIGAANREIGAKTASGFTPASATGGPLPAPALGGTSTDAAPTGTVPLPPSDPPATPPAVPPSNPFTEGPKAVAEGPKPIAMGSGTGVVSAPAMPPAPAMTDAPAAEFSKTPRFDLKYTLDGGPSGVARVDLYVTRDDGRSWVRWSSHDGRETPLKVILDTRFNKEVEGDYGFVLVPVSGAGLSDTAPTAGTAPEMRLRVDTTSPVIKVFQPTADANNRNALLLHWEATDKNFGKEPLTVEYSEQPTGPWRSVAGGDVVPVAAGGATAPTRLENTGSYSWQPPLTLTTPKVYLKFTAVDLAGNKSEVVTPNPILVDLTKPKARIQGISPSAGR